MTDENDPRPGDVMTALFPVDTGKHVSVLLGVPRRSADRLISGYSRTPPKLLQKLEDQVEPRRQFDAAIRKAIAEAEAAGLHPLILRQALVDRASVIDDGEHHEPF
ncbi:hypothetical protein [Aureimonas mangrovi]|uniref:hypothetical protein n=1 Tax=Aureimonas mangrovi TaxID=2758041 RepID=UPI00163DD58B|nr:hypothetical protein [Aureimonas mangrovi]